MREPTSEHKLRPPEPLKGTELDQALKAIKKERGINPTVVNRLLIMETSEIPGVSKLDKIVPAALLAGYIGTFAATRLAGGELPDVGIPQALHQVLQAVHNLSVNSARQPTLSEHLPILLLEGAGVWGVVKTFPNWLKARGKRQQIKETQGKIREEASEGKLRYSMASGHTAAFVGLGDPLANRLQQIKDLDQVMLYSHARIDNQVWQLLSKDGQQEQIYQALDRGNFQNAGEVLLLPVKYEDMFLPDKTGHDMSIDEVAAMINVVDEYSQSRGLPKKRVIIVGSKEMEESYVQRSSERETQESQKTLTELVNEINQKRKGARVEIVDPTEIVMKKIIALADGRTIRFVSTKESDQRYGQRFYGHLKAEDYQPTAAEIVNILYNITDIPTEVGAAGSDIAVILDTSKKQGLQAKGLPEENIILVPDVVLQVLSGKVEES